MGERVSALEKDLLKIDSRRLHHLWNTLTEPTEDIQEPERRRQARLLSALGLIGILLAYY